VGEGCGGAAPHGAIGRRRDHAEAGTTRVRLGAAAILASTCSAGRTAGAAPSPGEPVPTASATEIAAARPAAAAGALLAHSAKRKGASEKPQTTPRPTKPGYIAAHVKRAVWKRDGGRCQWPVSGGVCGSTYQVEFDHRKARALGGGAAVEDIRLLCKSHNLESARETFGDEWMARFTRARPRRTRGTEPGGTDSRSGPP
jgi:5-methylcytosine-specific restriction endonuclease McrA